jgi:hypothetical protein
MDPIHYAIPGTTYVSVDSLPEEACDICLEPLAKDVVAHQTDNTAKPKHPLHKACIQKWLPNQAQAQRGAITCIRCKESVAGPPTLFSRRNVAVVASAGAFVGIMAAQYPEMVPLTKVIQLATALLLLYGFYKDLQVGAHAW